MKITKELVVELRQELNEAVKSVAEKHGLDILFGNATYSDTEATFKVAIQPAATEDYDPAKANWDKYCRAYGFEPDDYGMEFTFLGERVTYRISGIKPNARSNAICITRVRDGKQFVTSAANVKASLKQPASAGNVPPVVTQVAPPPSTDEQLQKAKKEWDLHCWMWGMTPEMLGKTFSYNGKTFRIMGINPKARKNCVQIQDVVTGKDYVAPPEEVKRCLGTA